jgi:hypothetical protein
MSNGWSINNRVNVMAGMVSADNHYYGFSGNIDTVPFQNFYASMGFLGSIDNLSQTDGTKTTLDLGYSLPWGIGVSLGGVTARLTTAKCRSFTAMTTISRPQNMIRMSV